MPEKLKIAVIGTDSDNLAIATGFGSWEKVKAFSDTISRHYKNVTLFKANSRSDLEKIASEKPDLVVTGAKYIVDGDEKIWLPEFFEDKAINYTGSTRKTMEIELNKSESKEIVSAEKIKTADYFTASPGQFTGNSELPLKFPLFVKPLGLFDSIGVNENSLVHNFAEFERQVKYINDNFNQKAIIEPFLSGREFTVAVINNKGRLETFPVELEPENGKFITFQAKEDNTETLKKITDRKIHTLISGLAKKAFKSLGTRDYGRIDIKMNDTGILHFTEFTTTHTGAFPC